jgi:hypothetical protein
MFKKSKMKSSIKGATVKAFKKKVVQKKQMKAKVSATKKTINLKKQGVQHKMMSVPTPSQVMTQQVARRPQVRQMAVATPDQKSTQVMTPQERMAKSKSVLAYAAGLTQSSRADKTKREASLNARLREATRGK